MTTPFEEDEDLEGPELRSTSIENLSQDQIDDNVREANNALAYYSPSARIVLPEGATRSEAIEHLAKEIPVNEYGLPTFFYRSDMLPYELGMMTQDDADAAMITLEYDEGYPTFNRGHLFWQQLPHETLNDFLLFQRFLDQANILGLRQLQILGMENNVSLEKCHSLYHEYFWPQRAKAHDLFRVAADRKKRELRARNLENDHFITAGNLLEQLKTKFSDSGDIFKDLSGKEMLECLRLLINIQRVSNGLPQNGNAGAVPFNPDSALGGKELMEDITRNLERGDGGLGLNQNLLELMKDPNFTMEAQRIILRVRQHSDPNSHLEVKPLDQ